jgi:glucose/arabinose dehydrogenase
MGLLFAVVPRLINLVRVWVTSRDAARPAGKVPGTPWADLPSTVNHHRTRAPVGLAQDKEGALLIADDVGDAIWRVTAANR